MDTLSLNFAGGHPAQTEQERANEQFIREVYANAEGTSKNTPKFVSSFSDDGYFYDVAAGKRYYGQEIGNTVDIYANAFPDIHRELYKMYFSGDMVMVELSLNGTHNGDLVLPFGVVPPTHREMHTPCADFFHVVDGKVSRFHCYVAVPMLLNDLGIFLNISAALKK